MADRGIVRLWRKHFGPKRDATPPPIPESTGDLDAYVWRILVAAYGRILAKQLGRDHLSIPDRELHAMLEPYHADLSRDARAIAMAIRQARTEGMESVRSALHRAEGVDHAMIDQALDYAYSTTKVPAR